MLEWLAGFFDGPGFADAVPALSIPGVFVSRVPGTSIVVTIYVASHLRPPAIGIREIG